MMVELQDKKVVCAGDESNKEKQLDQSSLRTPCGRPEFGAGLTGPVRRTVNGSVDRKTAQELHRFIHLSAWPFGILEAGSVGEFLRIPGVR